MKMTRADVLRKLGTPVDLLKFDEYNREMSAEEFSEYVALVYFGILSIFQNNVIGGDIL